MFSDVYPAELLLPEQFQPIRRNHVREHQCNLLCIQFRICHIHIPYNLHLYMSELLFPEQYRHDREVQQYHLRSCNRRLHTYILCNPTAYNQLRILQFHTHDLWGQHNLLYMNNRNTHMYILYNRNLYMWEVLYHNHNNGHSCLLLFLLQFQVHHL